MRCKICDFSPSNPPSLYRDGLVFPSGQNHVDVVAYNYKTGTYSCPLCSEESQEDLGDLIKLDEDFEVDDNETIDEGFDDAS